MHLWTAIGSSQDPGTDSTTMLDSLTPQASSLAFVPSRRGWMMVSFQRAWTMPTRRALPSWTWGAGPLVSECILRGGSCGWVNGVKLSSGLLLQGVRVEEG